MSIRVRWPLGVLPIAAAMIGAAPASAQFNRFGFGGPTAIGPIPVVSSYNWEINNATGAPYYVTGTGPGATYSGPGLTNNGTTVSGWSSVQVTPNSQNTRHGDFYWDASPTNKLSFSMVTLTNPTSVGQDTPTGPMANFDPTRSFAWSIVTFTGSYLTQDTTDYPSGPPTLASVLNASTNFDFSGFVNLTQEQISALNTPGNPYLGWNIHLNSPGGNGGELDLVYSPTPVPEPGTLVLTALGLAGVWRWRSSRILASRERKRPEY